MIEREERDGERTRDREEGREPSIGQYIIVVLGGRTTERESLKLEKKKIEKMNSGKPGQLCKWETNLLKFSIV